jgi:hypothetical protein
MGSQAMQKSIKTKSQNRHLRYDLKGCVEIHMNDRRYYVRLETELVIGEVFARNGRVVLRKVTSREIETSALLRASDKAHA